MCYFECGAFFFTLMVGVMNWPCSCMFFVIGGTFRRAKSRGSQNKAFWCFVLRSEVQEVSLGFEVSMTLNLKPHAPPPFRILQPARVRVSHLSLPSCSLCFDLNCRITPGIRTRSFSVCRNSSHFPTEALNMHSYWPSCCSP